MVDALYVAPSLPITHSLMQHCALDVYIRICSIEMTSMRKLSIAGKKKEEGVVLDFEQEEICDVACKYYYIAPPLSLPPPLFVFAITSLPLYCTHAETET